MSFSKQKREIIKHYILEQIEAGRSDVVSKTVDAFGMTSTSVYRYIRDLASNGIIKKKGHKYSLENESEVFIYDTGKVSDEVDIMKRDLEPVFSYFSDNVKRIWRYSLSEMINNVLDHSESTRFAIICTKNYMNTSFLIVDNGIGKHTL